MGFIKRSDGDTDHVINRVFEDVEEMVEDIVEHTESDDDELCVVTMPVEPLSAEEIN